MGEASGPAYWASPRGLPTDEPSGPADGAEASEPADGAEASGSEPGEPGDSGLAYCSSPAAHLLGYLSRPGPL